MEQEEKKEEKKQQTNEEKSEQCGCFDSFSEMGNMMQKMMDKMCGSEEKKPFNCESMMSEFKCCSESK